MLTDYKIKNTQPRAKPFKLHDGRGLYLMVSPKGAKRWEYRYRYPGANGDMVAKSLSFGSYKQVGLREARDCVTEACQMLRDGRDPSAERKRRKLVVQFDAQNTFRAVTEDWLTVKSSIWTPKHAKKVHCRLECHILPALGARPIADISVLDVLHQLKAVEAADKTEMSHRLLQMCRSIFQHAVLMQKIKYNPANDLRGVLKSHRVVSYPTLNFNELPQFFADLAKTSMSPITRLAILILVTTFVRTGELRQGKWRDIDLEAREWRLPPRTTKMRNLHIVPLSEQAVSLFRRLKNITGEGEYLFPTINKNRHPILCENAVNYAIHRIKDADGREQAYKGRIVGHGFRSLASTYLNENGFAPDAIERQLAHMPADRVRAAYNRAQYLPQRQDMMHWWGNQLEQSGLIEASQG